MAQHRLAEAQQTLSHWQHTVPFGQQPTRLVQQCFPAPQQMPEVWQHVVPGLQQLKPQQQLSQQPPPQHMPDAHEQQLPGKFKQHEGQHPHLIALIAPSN